jgi:hypothetical protein
MAQSRIYVVKTAAGEHLVEAANPSQAIRFITFSGVTCDAASSKDVARLLNAGVKLQDATRQPQGDPPPAAAPAAPARS